MWSSTTLLTLMAMALLLTFCAAAPRAEPFWHVASNAGNLNITSLPDAVPDNSTTNGTNINTANNCYSWDSCEKWKDVGGQYSGFVKQAVYDLCNLIAAEAYKGFPSSSTVSGTLSKYPASLLLSPLDTHHKP